MKLLAPALKGTRVIAETCILYSHDNEWTLDQPMQPSSYFHQRQDVEHSQKIMYYFPPEKLPVLTTLATEFAVFNRWFASIPGPTICNRAFAHYGTSFGRVDMNLLYVNEPFKSIE